MSWDVWFAYPPIVVFNILHIHRTPQVDYDVISTTTIRRSLYGMRKWIGRLSTCFRPRVESGSSL